MDDVGRVPPTHSTKIFIQRDYTDGTMLKFQTKFPPELENKIERPAFEYTVNRMNEMYEEAETFSSRTCCESVFACCTAYLSYLCMETYYDKVYI